MLILLISLPLPTKVILYIKNSNNEDVAQVKDVFRIEMLDISASAGNGLIQGR